MLTQSLTILWLGHLLGPVATFCLRPSWQRCQRAKAVDLSRYMGHAHPSTMTSLQGEKKKTIHGSMIIDRKEYKYINTILYYIIVYYTILYYVILYYTLLYYIILYWNYTIYTMIYSKFWAPVWCSFQSYDPPSCLNIWQALNLPGPAWRRGLGLDMIRSRFESLGLWYKVVPPR